MHFVKKGDVFGGAYCNSDPSPELAERRLYARVNFCYCQIAEKRADILLVIYKYFIHIYNLIDNQKQKLYNQN